MMSQPLMLTFCYFVLILVVLPIFCSDKVYSVFYQEDAAENEVIDRMKSESRKRGVLNYMLSLDPQTSLSSHEARLSEFLDNLIIVIAKKPVDKDDLVLSQLVTELDRNIRSDLFYRNAMIVCNASRVPFGELGVLSNFYPVRLAENTTSWIKKYNTEEVIKHDFVDCLSLAVNLTQTKHITVIRDRVVPYSGFLSSLNHVLSSKVSSYIRRGDLHRRESSWLFMHLQEPVPFRHYTFSFDCVRELFLIACFGSLVFYFAFRLLEWKTHPSFPTCSFIILGALYFGTLALIIGRPYISELRRTASALHRVYDPGEPVHFSAMSIPTGSINELLLHLSRLRCSNYVPFHKVLDDMVNTLERPAFVISPSLVRYVVKS